MSNLIYQFANPRLVFTMTLATDTPLTLKDAIVAFLTANVAELFGSDTPALKRFLGNISWNIKEPSSIGRSGGTGTLTYITKFLNASDGTLPEDPNYYTDNGVEILDGTERTVTGHAETVILYSELGTNVLVDLIFEPGA
jgi:hypothetical protein